MALQSILQGKVTAFAAVSDEFTCYCMISNANHTRESVYIEVDWFYSQAARDEGKSPIYRKGFYGPAPESDEYKSYVTAAGGSPTGAAYAWLKTQPDFAGAVDIP